MRLSVTRLRRIRVENAVPVERTEESGLGKSTRSSLVVMACTLVSRFLGFARIAAITGVFGAGIKADIINLTFSIPNNLRKLLAEGALSSAFVPELSRSLVRDPGGGNARRLVRSLLTFQAIVIVPICLAAIVWARPLLTHVLSEFDDPEVLADATRLFRLFINYLLLISVSAVLMGVLNARHRFFIPAFAPILFSVSVISAIYLLSGRLDIYSVAVGVLVGGLLQLLFQLPLFARLGYSLRPRRFLSDPAFRRVLMVWLPVLATSSLFTITYQVAIRFASGLGEGSVTSLAIAITFFQLPFGIFSASVTTVLFPRMSRQVASSDDAGLRESLQYGLRFLGVLLIPSMVFLWVSGEALISVAFQRGEFPYERTVATARVLLTYALGLYGVGAFTFLQRLFYAQHRHVVPFYAGLVVAVLDVTLSLWLKETALGTAGIALANSVSFTIGFVILFVRARLDLGPIGGRKLLATGLKTVAAMIPASAAVLGIRRVTGEFWVSGSSWTSFTLLFIEFLLFCSVVLAIYRLTRVEMMSILKRRRNT